MHGVRCQSAAATCFIPPKCGRMRLRSGAGLCSWRRAYLRGTAHIAAGSDSKRTGIEVDQVNPRFALPRVIPEPCGVEMRTTAGKSSGASGLRKPRPGSGIGWLLRRRDRHHPVQLGLERAVNRCLRGGDSSRARGWHGTRNGGTLTPRRVLGGVVKSNQKPWTPDVAHKMKDRIDPKPQYQRGSVWTRKQQQLLMDSIFQGMDIPKLYLRSLSAGGPVDQPEYEFEVVDGQQRLRAIWEFFDGGYALSKDGQLVVDGQDITGLRYAELPSEAWMALARYPLSVVELEASDEEVEEMFVRLQNGTTLRAAEIRNAMPGDMKLFVRELAEHPFFLSCRFANKRRDYDHVAAQMTKLELEGEPTDVKNTRLEAMYVENQVFDTSGIKAKKVRKVLDLLRAAFPAKNPFLEKYNAVALYLVFSHLIENFHVADRSGELRAWFEKFEKRRLEDRDKPEDQRVAALVSYQQRTSHATDSVDSLRFRMETLLESLHSAIPHLKPLDPQRAFTDAQRKVIWIRDGKRCQVRTHCAGQECDWENWHADHKIPWSRGGTTTVENGQVCCPSCNLSKGATETLAEPGV
jgi:hypothetical protein